MIDCQSVSSISFSLCYIIINNMIFFHLTAPESLNFGKYTTLSDVWSYGVLMWEIYSRGQTPYTGMSNSKAREMIEANYRMPAPDGTPDVIYQLMARCWQYEPDQRPRFAEIFQEIDVLLNSDLLQ